MERYRNKRTMFRNGGRFTKAPTLSDIGFDVSDGSILICEHCGNEQRPLLRSGWTCAKCGKTNGKTR